MRISANKDDPGYSPVVQHATVYIDGKKVGYGITADTEEGFVEVYETRKYDPESKALRIPTDENGIPQTKILRGHVVIVWEDIEKQHFHHVYVNNRKVNNGG